MTPHSCEQVAIHLDVAAALRAGIRLYRSTNGVLLSPGDAQGRVPPSLFKAVVDLSTGASLLPEPEPEPEPELCGPSSVGRPAAAQLHELTGDLFAPVEARGAVSRTVIAGI